MRSRPPLPARVLLLCCGLAAACGADDTALKIHLVGDQQLNTSRQLLAVVQSLELVLDAPAGFAGVAGAGPLGGELAAEDVDRDGVLELLLRREVQGRSALPLLRLLPGSNLGRSFKLNARGLAGADVAALGGLAAVGFASGASLDLLVPFNLRAAYRAPRVLVTLPRDGQADVPPTLTQIFVELSKEVLPATLESGLRVVYEGAGAPQPVPGKWVTGTTQLVDVGLAETRATATFHVECLLSAGPYRIAASAGITDSAGVGLDQDAAQPGPDEFSARFEIPGPVGAGPCAEDTPFECKEPRDCDPEGTGKYTCVVTERGGQCVPTVADCAGIACGPGYVCAPTPTPPPPTPCQPTCDDKCVAELVHQGLKLEEAQQKCCQPCPPAPSACQPECDQGCVDDLRKQGVTDQAKIEAQCCKPCADAPQPPFQCIQDCRSVGYCPPGSNGSQAFCDDGSGLCVPCSQQPAHPACAESRYTLCKERCAKECAESTDACQQCFRANGCELQQ